MDHVKIETDARGVTTLWLARPGKHNALSAKMIGELTQAALQLGQDANTRVVVLRGEGKTFCAGGDLGWMKDQVGATPESRKEGALHLAHMLKALNELPKPLIGAVHANAFGGGVGMMSVCDVAIGVKGAKFGLTETRLGLIPATIGPYVIKRMGEGKARRVFFSSRLFDADEAVSLDLLAKAVEADALDAAIEAEITPYLSCAPGAVAAAKKHAQRLAGEVTDADLEASADALVAQWEGNEAIEGITAFFEKRGARWTQ